jgi:hypothetical protein
MEPESLRTGRVMNPEGLLTGRARILAAHEALVWQKLTCIHAEKHRCRKGLR